MMLPSTLVCVASLFLGTTFGAGYYDDLVPAGYYGIPLSRPGQSWLNPYTPYDTTLNINKYGHLLNENGSRIVPTTKWSCPCGVTGLPSDSYYVKRLGDILKCDEQATCLHTTCSNKTYSSSSQPSYPELVVYGCVSYAYYDGFFKGSLNEWEQLEMRGLYGQENGTLYDKYAESVCFGDFCSKPASGKYFTAYTGNGKDPMSHSRDYTWTANGSDKGVRATVLMCALLEVLSMWAAFAI